GHTRLVSDWSSDVCSSDLAQGFGAVAALRVRLGEAAVGVVADRCAAVLVELRGLCEGVATRALRVVVAAERAVRPRRGVIEVGQDRKSVGEGEGAGGGGRR